MEDALLGAVGQAVLTIGSQLLLNDDLQQLSVAYPKNPLSEEPLRQLLHPGAPRLATGPPTLT